MGINVAGTNAIGDYLASEISNARTLMGAVPQTLPAPPAAAPSGSAATVASQRANFASQVLAQRVANTQALFGIQSADAANTSALPPLSTQTPQQLAYVAMQSSNIASQFSNIATLFGSLGLGTTTNTSA